MKLVPTSLKRVVLALAMLGALVVGAAAHTSNAEARDIGDFCGWFCDRPG